MVAAGDEELIDSVSSLVAVGAFDEIRSLRHDVCNQCRRGGPQAEPSAVLSALEQRPAPAWRAGRRLRRSCAVGLSDDVSLQVNGERRPARKTYAPQGGRRRRGRALAAKHAV